MRTIEEAKATPVGHHAFIPFALACAECGRGRDDVVHGCELCGTRLGATAVCRIRTAVDLCAVVCRDCLGRDFSDDEKRMFADHVTAYAKGRGLDVMSEHMPPSFSTIRPVGCAEIIVDHRWCEVEADINTAMQAAVVIVDQIVAAHGPGRIWCASPIVHLIDEEGWGAIRGGKCRVRSIFAHEKREAEQRGRGLRDLYARAGDILRRQSAVANELWAQSVYQAVYQERDAWSRSGVESAGISREQAQRTPALSPAWFAQREEEARRFRTMPRDLVPSSNTAASRSTGCKVCGGTLYYAARQIGDGLCSARCRLGEIVAYGASGPPVLFPDDTPRPMSWHIPAAPTDPLDAVIDGVTLRDLLTLDEHRRQETSGVVAWRIPACGDITPAQRAAVSAHWSAELRARVASSKERERVRVVVDLEDE